MYKSNKKKRDKNQTTLDIGYKFNYKKKNIEVNILYTFTHVSQIR